MFKVACLICSVACSQRPIVWEQGVMVLAIMHHQRCEDCLKKMNKINICGQNVLWESIYFDCKTSPVELIVIVPSKVNFETSPVSPVLGKCCYFKYPIQKRSVDIPLAIGKSGKLLTEPNPHFYKSDHQSSNCSRDDWNCCKGEIEAN